METPESKSVDGVKSTEPEMKALSVESSHKIPKSMYIIIGVAFGIIMLLVGLLFGGELLSDSDTGDDVITTEDVEDEDEDLEIEEEVVVEDEVPECDETVAYTNAMFPEFGFTYDDCYWDLTEGVESDVTYGVTLTNSASDTLDFSIQGVAVFGGLSECGNFGHELVSGIMGRTLQDMSGLVWNYKSEIYVPGTAAFDDSIAFNGTGPEVGPDYTYCFNTLPFVTPTTYAYTIADYDPGDGSGMLGIMSVNYQQSTGTSDPMSLDKADEVVVTMSY